MATCPGRYCVGNGTLMAALDAGCARTLWPLTHTFALAKGRASSENVSTPLIFLPSYLRSLHTFLPVCNLPQAFPLIELSSINHDIHLHLSGFSPLRKILTINHYLRSPDFQHTGESGKRVISCGYYSQPSKVIST